VWCVSQAARPLRRGLILPKFGMWAVVVMSLIPPSSVSLSCQFAPELFDYPGRAFIAFIIATR
ncbi:MAG: hypothetical protein WAV79_20000, partial [Anaerolineae bacterium]